MPARDQSEKINREADQILAAAKQASGEQRQAQWAEDQRQLRIFQYTFIGILAVLPWFFILSAAFLPGIWKTKTTPVEANGMIVDVRSKHRCGKTTCDTNVYFLIGETADGECHVAYWPAGWDLQDCTQRLRSLESDDCSVIPGGAGLCQQIVRDLKRPESRKRRSGITFHMRDGRVVDADPR